MTRLPDSCTPRRNKKVGEVSRPVGMGSRELRVHVSRVSGETNALKRIIGVKIGPRGFNTHTRPIRLSRAIKLFPSTFPAHSMQHFMREEFSSREGPTRQQFAQPQSRNHRPATTVTPPRFWFTHMAATTMSAQARLAQLEEAANRLSLLLEQTRLQLRDEALQNLTTASNMTSSSTAILANETHGTSQRDALMWAWVALVVSIPVCICVSCNGLSSRFLTYWCGCKQSKERVLLGLLAPLMYICLAAIASFIAFVHWLVPHVYNLSVDKDMIAEQAVDWQINFHIGSYGPFICMGIYCLYMAGWAVKEHCWPDR